MSAARFRDKRELGEFIWGPTHGCTALCSVFSDIFTNIAINFYSSKRSRAAELKAEKAKIELARALLA